MADVGDAVTVIRAGRLAIVPRDTVYGIASSPAAEAVEALYRAKGRERRQPTALVAADLDRLVELLPELPARALAIARALLPGSYTLILPNPADRFPWLAGERRDAIGVRVPALTGPGRELLERVGTLVAPSANLPGGAAPHTVADVPAQLLAAVAAVVDAGELPGTPSTVVDVTGDEPLVLREGAVPADVALRAIGSVL